MQLSWSSFDKVVLTCMLKNQLKRWWENTFMLMIFCHLVKKKNTIEKFMVWDYHTHWKIGHNMVMFGDGELDGELSSTVSTFRTGTSICLIDYSGCWRKRRKRKRYQGQGQIQKSSARTCVSCRTFLTLTLTLVSPFLPLATGIVDQTNTDTSPESSYR